MPGVWTILTAARPGGEELGVEAVGPPALGSRGVGRRQLAVGGTPNALDIAAAADEQSRRGHRDEGYQECVFDQILTRFIGEEVFKLFHGKSMEQSRGEGK